MKGGDSGKTNVLALDLGSSSVRAALYDGAGAPVDGTEVKLDYDLDYTRDGGATKSAEEVLDLLTRAIDGALSKAGGASVSCVGASTFWHSVTGLDQAGNPVTPILTWADRRSAAEAADLRMRLDESAVHRRTGCVLHSSYLPAKLLWLSRNHPEQFARAERFVSVGEYLYEQLFGGDAVTVGTSMASATGLFDQHRLVWDEGMLDALPIDEAQLSPISDEPASGLTAEYAERWPALADVPWFPAVGDGACSNAGSGCVTEDRLALMVGTSGALRVLWKAGSVEIPDGPWCYRADAERFVMGGALSNGGNLVQWLRDTLRLPEPGEIDKQLSRMEPDSHGLTFLPLLAGERGPAWADHANGTIAGLSMTSGPVEIMRAAMESVALRFAIIAEQLESTSPGEKEIVATGGGLLNSPTWTRIMADVLGRPVTLSGVKEASSRGAALLALEKLGTLKIEDIEAPLGDTFDPDPERHKVYRNALERQRRLYDAVMRSSGTGE
ncbi:MAG TPA: gluconokinase [Rubrobacteraceae bacterium]|nr:gluconokinase [Rubrobacteraceae bacterium]